MKEKKLGNNSFLIRLDKGDEIIESLTNFSRANKLGFASVSGIGAASRAVISVFNMQEKRYIEQGFEGNLEIVSLLGNVTMADGIPRIHLHAAITGDDLNVHGGHLVSATVSVTCEIVLDVSKTSIKRSRDEVTRLMLISD